MSNENGRMAQNDLKDLPIQNMTNFYTPLFGIRIFFPYGHFGGLHICHKNIQVGMDQGGQKGQWLDFVGCFFWAISKKSKKTCSRVKVN